MSITSHDLQFACDGCSGPASVPIIQKKAKNGRNALTIEILIQTKVGQGEFTQQWCPKCLEKAIRLNRYQRRRKA